MYCLSIRQGLGIEAVFFMTCKINRILKGTGKYHFNMVFSMPLSGKEMLKLYEQDGWRVLRQKGSHVIVGKGSLRAVIPMHRELKKGLEQQLLKFLGAK